MLPGAAAVRQTATSTVLVRVATLRLDPPAGARGLLSATLALALGPHLVRLLIRRRLDAEVRPS